MTKSQNKPIVIGTPIEIEFACNEIRKTISTLDWISHPYFIAQRFFKKDATTNKRFIYPETYAPSVDENEEFNSKNYHRLTPDNDYSGMCFFMVSRGTNDFKANEYNFLTYQVGIIFSVNLELIDAVKLRSGLFTQELMREVRRKLTESVMLFDFDYSIQFETRDLREVYREFQLDDLEQYNRAPLQCFRFDLELKVQEQC